MPRRDRDELLRGEDIANEESIIDEEESVEFGIRRSRRATTSHHRDSSGLYPAERMEQDVCYTYAEEAVARSLYIAQLVSILFAVYNHYNSFIVQWQRLESTMADAIAVVRNKMQAIKKQIDGLLLVMRWIISYGELALLQAEDLSIYIRFRSPRFTPIRHRRISDIDRRDCYTWFGLSPYNLRRLFQHWRIPETFTSPDRHVYTGEECFIIWLYHIQQGEPFTTMARSFFGGDPRSFTNMFDLMTRHLYFTFYNKISGRSLEQWIPRYLHQCRHLIHSALADGAIFETEYVDGEVVNQQWIMHHFDFETFRIFGFLDDFGMPTARPSSRPSRFANALIEFAHDIQRAFYSGYFRDHGLKAQVVYLPIGIIGAVYIAEIRQNDNGVLNMSGLNDYLVELLHGIFINGLFPCLYCDGIFILLACILPRFTNPTPVQHLLNMRLASLRECIEHLFADHKMRFKIFWVPRYLQMYNQGEKIRQMCLVSFFALNCYNCIAGTRSQYFGQIPPTLDDYLPLDEVLIPPPAVDLGDVWDYHDNAHNI